MAASTLRPLASSVYLGLLIGQALTQCQVQCEKNSRCTAILNAVSTRASSRHRLRARRHSKTGRMFSRLNTTVRNGRMYTTRTHARHYHGKGTRTSTSPSKTGVCIMFADEVAKVHRSVARASPWKAARTLSRRGDNGRLRPKYYVKKCPGNTTNCTMAKVDSISFSRIRAVGLLKYHRHASSVKRRDLNKNTNVSPESCLKECLSNSECVKVYLYQKTKARCYMYRGNFINVKTHCTEASAPSSSGHPKASSGHVEVTRRNL